MKAYTLEEIIVASEERRIIKPVGDHNRRVLLQTRVGYSFSSSDIPKLTRFLELIKSTYNLKFELCGGGYGCLKLIIYFSSAKEASNFVNNVKEDAPMIKEAREVKIHIIASQETLIRTEDLPRVSSNDQFIDDNPSPKNNEGLVSGDGESY